MLIKDLSTKTVSRLELQPAFAVSLIFLPNAIEPGVKYKTITYSNDWVVSCRILSMNCDDKVVVVHRRLAC